LRDTVTGEESAMPAQGMFVAIGYKPNTDLFKGHLDLDPRGYCKTAADGDTNTNVEGVFVAGDVHDHRYRQAVTAAGDGCKAAIDVERWLESIGEVERVTATNW
jgi:thioredoxin reductase (NADPH)